MTKNGQELVEAPAEAVTPAQIEAAMQECDLVLHVLKSSLPGLRLARTKAWVLFKRAGINLDDLCDVSDGEIPEELVPLYSACLRLPDADEIKDIFDLG